MSGTPPATPPRWPYGPPFESHLTRLANIALTKPSAGNGPLEALTSASFPVRIRVCVGVKQPGNLHEGLPEEQRRGGQGLPSFHVYSAWLSIFINLRN